MKVQYKNGSLYEQEQKFPFRDGEPVAIVVRYRTTKEDLIYHGHIVSIGEGPGGFETVVRGILCVLSCGSCAFRKSNTVPGRNHKAKRCMRIKNPR